MAEADLIGKLRKEIGDEVEPYKFSPEYLESLIQDAVGDYSRYRPRKRKGTVNLTPGVTEFPLPADYQTWLTGLDGYEVLDKTIYLDSAPTSAVGVSFTYLADHTAETVPDRDTPILLDYCMWRLLSDIIREGAEISGLKLGKGLEIEFDNFNQVEKLAAKRLENYHRSVKKVMGGYS
jgi:hypothetical protein